MQIVLDIEELHLLPDAVRDGLLCYITQKAAPQSPKPFLEGKLGDGTGRGDRSLLYAGVAARDGEWCAQCGEEANLEVDLVVPSKLGGVATIENAQLLCRKHYAIKGHRLETGDVYTVGAISVEAAIALIEGLSDRSAKLLEAMVALGTPAGINRAKLMDIPEFGLKFKDRRSLNGVLTGIRKRFRNLLTEGERNSVDLFEYKQITDTYKLGEGTYSSIKEAFKYMDDRSEYQKNNEISQKAISLYRQGLGTKQLQRNLGELRRHWDAVLVLPTLISDRDSNAQQTFEEHFNVDGNWVFYGKNTEGGSDD